MRPSIFEAAGGLPAMLALAHAWHRRCLADPLLSHAFSHDFHPRHAERLAAYWAEALGGPAAYTGVLGDESGVTRMHAGNGEHVEMDERGQTAFASALDDAGLPADPALRASLRAYFRWVTEAYTDYPRSAEDVPAGLAIRRWSWHGPC